MNEISFTIPGEPFGKQRPRFSTAGNRVKTYTPEETAVYEDLVRLAYMRAGGGAFPDGAALGVRITAYYGVPKSTGAGKRRLMLEHRLRPTKKPDWDNIGKVICDALNAAAYRDDSAIADARVIKLYSEEPRVEVTLSEIAAGKEGRE